MADKITRKMVLKVDLGCSTCHRKIKKVLAKFPQIQDQNYDPKQNTVTITVVCCSPEKLRDKLCCKGGKTIKSIEIIEPPKPKPKEPEKKEPEPEKKKEEKKKEPEKKPDNPQPEKAKPEPEKTKIEKPKPEPEKAKKPDPGKPAPNPPPPVLVPVPVQGYPPGYPHGTCCGSCYEGRGGGPCYQGYGRPDPSYDNYGYGANRGGYCRCDYFSEENTSGCTIM